MKIGACYDLENNELRVRIRGVSRTAAWLLFHNTALFLQALPFSDLRAIGDAIRATLEDGDEAGPGAGDPPLSRN